MSVFQHQLVDMHVITSHIYFIVHLQISSKKNQRMGAVLEMYNGDKASVERKKKEDASNEVLTFRSSNQLALNRHLNGKYIIL